MKAGIGIATEHQEQVAFVAWFRLQFPGVLIYAIPNGAYLAGNEWARAARMVKLKAEGLVPGIPDLHIPAWSLYVEMKRTKGGRVSPEQREAIHALGVAGQVVMVANGWEQASRMVQEYRAATV